MSVSEREKGSSWVSEVSSSLAAPHCCLSHLPLSSPQQLPPKLTGTKSPQVSSYKSQGGAIKSKDQGFEFSMTLVQGRGHHAYLAQFPSSMPSGKQGAAIWEQDSASLTISMMPSPGAVCAEPPELWVLKPNSYWLSEMTWSQRLGAHPTAPISAALHRGQDSGGKRGRGPSTEDRRTRCEHWVEGS